MELNRRNVAKIILIVACGALIFSVLSNANALKAFVSDIARLLSPFIAGGCVAFVVNVPMRGIERRLFAPRPGKAGRVIDILRRPVSMLLSFALMGALIFLVIFLAVPGFAKAYETIRDSVPKIITFLQDVTMDIDLSLPQIDKWLQSFEIDWVKFGQDMMNFLQTGMMNFITSAFSAVTVAAGGIVRTVLSLIFAVYLLSQKETLGKQSRRVFYAYMPQKRADAIIETARLSSDIFTRFVAGQCVEAFILGGMCLVGMLIFGFPNPLMISALIGFGNLIPIVGALICTAAAAFLILLTNPVQAFWFVAFVIVIQQVDNNLIYPRVVGQQIGLPAIWVLFAVAIGGSVGGILGMLVSVPVSSVLYTLLQKDTRKRLKQKMIKVE